MGERPTVRRALFRLVLRILPPEFRGEFGREMEADFAAQQREAGRAGTGAVVGLWLRTLPAIVRLALAERSAAFGADLHFAVRLMSRTPGFAVAAVATLAIGIGATTAVFSVVTRRCCGRSLSPIPTDSWTSTRGRSTVE